MKNNILSPYIAVHPYLNRIERALITGSSFMVVLTISSVLYDINKFQKLISKDDLFV